MSAILDASIAHAVRRVWPLPMLGDRSPVVSQRWRPFDAAASHLAADLMFRDPTVGRPPPRSSLEDGPRGDLDWAPLAWVSDGTAVALVGPPWSAPCGRKGPRHDPR